MANYQQFEAEQYYHDVNEYHDWLAEQEAKADHGPSIKEIAFDVVTALLGVMGPVIAMGLLWVGIVYALCWSHGLIK